MSLAQLRSISQPRESRRDNLLRLFVPIGGIALGMVIAYLVARGDWPIAMGILFAIPAMVIIHRYPFAALMIWLLLNPFMVDTSGGILRKGYWVIHRALPAATLGVILISHLLKIHERRLPRLGLPEVAMLGYLVATQLSVLYFSDQVIPTTFFLYDHIFVPMCLYLIVRLIKPEEKDLERLLPVLLFILLSQSVIGAISWIAPQVLPSAWLDRVGTRTTGSLDHYSVFSSTVMFCGLLLLHSALNHKMARIIRLGFVIAFILSLFMVFFSFSRGSWLGALLVLFGLVFLYPKFLLRLGLGSAVLIGMVLGSGFLADYITYAQQRFYSDQSEQSALSRLPVVYASLRMFESRPLFGWGYENFDKYDYQFQERVADLVTPEKDHASHNVYLTILAEQGIVSLFLYLTPVFWLLAMTVKVFPKMPKQGFWSGKLLIILWLQVVFFIVINNFSNMRVVFGLGMWWMTLGFIARMVDDYLPSPDVRKTAQHSLIGRLETGSGDVQPEEYIRRPVIFREEEQ